ncbi:unnamed protein product, partial [Anisakis simplex]|uniref:PA2c domain-containing protein n=1 Tax=Anisakis simplex TaxID=6269 RepID=A0A0M3JI22_ANISI
MDSQDFFQGLIMLHFVLGFAVLLCTVSSFEIPDNVLWNINGMAHCLLHHDGLPYYGYGCYCGFGDSGTPIDGID